jgi:hypothetical protein
MRKNNRKIRRKNAPAPVETPITFSGLTPTTPEDSPTSLFSDRTREVQKQRVEELEERLRVLEDLYNPERLNLWLEPLPRADAALLETLYSQMKEGWNVILLSGLGDWGNPSDILLLMQLEFLLNALGAIERSSAQDQIPKSLIRHLAGLLTETTRFTARNPGDITKRNIAALADLLYGFDRDGSIRQMVQKRAVDMDDTEAFKVIGYALLD